MSEKKVPVSVVIMTRNVQRYIKDCLESVTWAQEIMLVDYGSADKTLEIAAAYGPRILKESWDNEGAIRNRAYAQASCEWVLTLDADERISEELRAELTQLFSGTPENPAYSIPIRNIFGGSYWIRHGGWYPAYKIRLFRKDKFKYEEAEIHPRVFLDGRDGRLKGDIIHHCYTDFTHMVSKVNVQTALEARKWLRDGRNMTPGKAIVRTVSRFFKMYVQKKGYKDGLIGFMIAWQAATYQLLSYVKYWQARTLGGNADVEQTTLAYYQPEP